MPESAARDDPADDTAAAERQARRLRLAAVGMGVAAALFFTMTYVLNRASASSGGHWAWTACLRYLITLPLLWPLLRWQGGAAPVWRAIRAHPGPWLGCAALGFVLFYMLLSWAASSGPSWLIAGSFQFTVIAGMLCAPFIYRDARRRIPPAALAVGVLILCGVLLMQVGHAQGRLDPAAWLALACVLGAAVLFPLGNRLLLLHLERTGEALNATQRVFGMTLVSQPLWWLLALWAWQQAGPPPGGQVLLAAGVAVSAGIIAAVLFFQATGMVRDNPTALGAVEAMQASELLFAVLLGMLLLGEAAPRGLALWGGVVVSIGIVLFAWVAARSVGHDPRQVKALRTDVGG
ncbi:MAG: multidrug resistance efflux transporter family protein [Pseudoxanthomonas suwonensis]|nr:multidrug resistance efflux transporter family protein [Pseudoxanthomonas suwonensis]